MTNRYEGGNIEKGSRYESRENIPEGKVGVIACMDDDAHIDGVKFGFVASLATVVKTGNQELFPDSVRLVIDRNREKIFRALGKVAKKLNMPLGVSSHPGCGGAALQNIDGQDELNKLTKTQSEKAGVKYVGCLPVAYRPTQIIGEKGIFGYMAREESDHIHGDASYVDITVGGGIDDESKLKRVKKRGGKQAFELSADWVSYALKDGMSKGDVGLILRTEINIAKAIINKAGNKFEGVEIYNAGLLGNDINETDDNTRTVNELLAELDG